jgi:tetratricopeptide (TPR) repeat protein
VALTQVRCREALGPWAQAEAAYRTGLSERPDDVIWLTAAAEFYRRAGRDDQAEPLWRRLLDPSNAVAAEVTAHARRRLAVLLAGADLDAKRSTYRDEALELLEANRRQLGANLTDERIRLFVRGSSAGERADVITAFRASLQQQPATADEQVLLARLYVAAGRLPDARDELSQVVALDRAGPEPLVRLVDLLIRTDELAEAEAFLARLERIEPTSARTRALRDALRQAATP